MIFKRIGFFLALMGCFTASALAQSDYDVLPGRCTTIALTPDDRRLVVVNRQNDSVSIIEVVDRNGHDTSHLVAELSVGQEPRYVAVSPDGKTAFVTNTVDGTVVVIDLDADHPTVVGDPLHVGTEPRCIVLTPNGKWAFVAHHTSGKVSVIDTAYPQVINTVATGGHPLGIAITNDGDDDDQDERVYVTRFFSELIDPDRPDGFDDAKQGVIDAFYVDDAQHGSVDVQQIILPPLDSGFKADRRQFCAKTRQILQDAGEVVFFNSGPDGDGDGAAALANEVFCPDPDSDDASPDGPIGSAPQGVYPNLLHALLIRGEQLFVLNVGAQPEPPVIFNNNVQALVGVVALEKEKVGKHDFSFNLNAQVAQETPPESEPGSFDRLFLNDVVAMDADREGKQFLLLSRGGNYVMRAKRDGDGKLDIGADSSNQVVRLQTGNIPSGVVMNATATRAYTNNEVNTSVTSLDLESNQVMIRDIPSSNPPAPGSDEHRELVGKLLFHTALGIPDVHDLDGDDHFDIAIRDIEPLQFRGQASRDGWSSCASCHEDGHLDQVTWLFPTGPRQTIELAGSFEKNNPDDQRIMNWNAVRGSPSTDFDQNSRGVQGGIGHATDVNGENRTAEIFNHGPVVGISDALDAMHEWIATIRSPLLPDPTDPEQGRAVFEASCASCHGGVKWTKSRTSPLYLNNPTFAEDPLGAGFFDGVEPLDPQLTVAGPQIVAVTNEDEDLLRFVENVGTFDPGSLLEIRGAGAIAGQSTQGFPALSADGAFNVPSLLGIGFGAPYLHDGIAQTLEEVFAIHQLGDQTIEEALSAHDRADLLAFLNAIDDETAPFESDADRFLDTILGP